MESVCLESAAARPLFSYTQRDLSRAVARLLFAVDPTNA
jgi:hypothetical protein